MLFAKVLSLLHTIEMTNTIFQLRDACHLAYTNDIRSSLQHIVSMWIARRPSRVNKRIRMLRQQANRSVPLISTIWNNKEISFYSTVCIGQVRVKSAGFSSGKRMNDSSIIVKIGGIEQFIIIKEIFSVKGYSSFLQVC